MSEMKQMRLLLATHNSHKIWEMRALLDAEPIVVFGMEWYPEVPVPEETGATFRENAIIKAAAIAKATGCYALADDSGLCIDALAGAPGVYSARWCGVGATPQENVAKALHALDGVPAENRTAHYECWMALANPTGDIVAEGFGAWKGAIATAPVGTSDFGYDSIFLVEGDDAARTAGQLSTDEKNAQSHRGQAIRALLPTLINEMLSKSPDGCEADEVWVSPDGREAHVVPYGGVPAPDSLRLIDILSFAREAGKYAAQRWEVGYCGPTTRRLLTQAALLGFAGFPCDASEDGGEDETQTELVQVVACEEADDDDIPFHHGVPDGELLCDEFPFGILRVCRRRGEDTEVSMTTRDQSEVMREWRLERSWLNGCVEGRADERKAPDVGYRFFAVDRRPADGALILHETGEELVLSLRVSKQA